LRAGFPLRRPHAARGCAGRENTFRGAPDFKLLFSRRFLIHSHESPTKAIQKNHLLLTAVSWVAVTCLDVLRRHSGAVIQTKGSDEC
jgi:hypothetical protein